MAAIRAAVPDPTRNGTSGTTAPTENVRNDEMAAPHGEPSPPAGSRPSSSRACVSNARSGFLWMTSTSDSATSWGTPLRW